MFSCHRLTASDYHFGVFKLFLEEFSFVPSSA